MHALNIYLFINMHVLSTFGRAVTFSFFIVCTSNLSADAFVLSWFYVCSNKA